MSTPRTDAQAGWAIANQYGQSTASELLGATDGVFVHAVFARTLERELTTLTAERDQLRAAVALGQINCDNAYDDLRTERDQLRAELATERARLDWLEDNSVCYHVCIDRQPDGYSIHNSPPSLGSVRAAIDAAMKEDSK